MRKLLKLLCKLFVRNVRLGFATNSSSSHSLVFYKDGISLESTEEEFHWGWNDFVIADLPTKLAYGLANFSTLSWLGVEDHGGFIQHIRNQTEHLLMELDIDPEEVYKLFEDEDFPRYIDHQSTYSAHELSEDKQLRYLALLAEDNLVIHGGNDNNGLMPEHFMNDPYVEEVRPAQTPFSPRTNLPYRYKLRWDEDELVLAAVHLDKENDFKIIETELVRGNEAQVREYIASDSELFGDIKKIKIPVNLSHLNKLHVKGDMPFQSDLARKQDEDPLGS